MKLLEGGLNTMQIDGKSKNETHHHTAEKVLERIRVVRVGG